MRATPEIAAEVLLQPFTFIAVGQDHVDGERLIYISYSHEDAEAALANEQLFPELLEWLSDNTRGIMASDSGLSLVETSVEDTALLATLKYEDDQEMRHIVWSSLIQGHPIFSHG